MKLFKSHIDKIDEMVQYGFELALRYVKIAKQYDKDPVEMLEEKLKEWKTK